MLRPVPVPLYLQQRDAAGVSVVRWRATIITEWATKLSGSHSVCSVGQRCCKASVLARGLQLPC